MNKTSIEWCDFTANPIRYRDADGKSVWACVKASEGCQHCYAEALAHRYQGREFTARAMDGVTPYVDERELKAMLSPTKLPSGSKVFVGDMTDVFGPWVPFALLDQVFAACALRPDVVFQVLTKRPERMREYVTAGTDHQLGLEGGAVPITPGCGKTAYDRVFHLMVDTEQGRRWRRANPYEDFLGPHGLLPKWPLPNVWLGVSAENQHWADVRIPELLSTPAAVRFVSAEPLLGPVRLERLIHDSDCVSINDYYPDDQMCYCNEPREDHISWVIVGGESGPRARPCDVGWIRSIVAQCQAAGTKVFVKQLGARPQLDRHWRLDGDPDTVMVRQQIELRDRKGGDMAEWPL